MSFDIVFQQTQDSKKHSDRPISNAAFPVKYRLGKSAVAQIHREGICPMYKRDSRGVGFSRCKKNSGGTTPKDKETLYSFFQTHILDSH